MANDSTAKLGGEDCGRLLAELLRQCQGAAPAAGGAYLLVPVGLPQAPAAGLSGASLAGALIGSGGCGQLLEVLPKILQVLECLSQMSTEDRERFATLVRRASGEDAAATFEAVANSLGGTRAD